MEGKSRKTAVALLSGGIDSSTLVAQLLFEDFAVQALSIDYGQRHRKELSAAGNVAAALNVPLTIVDLSTALIPVFRGSGSSQVGQLADVPHGHYAAENMKTTIVPNRNMLLLAIAGALAESIKKPGEKVAVAYAAHAGDHVIYPDCRPDFYESCGETLLKATDGDVSLYAPFGKITKTDIVQRGAQLKVPFGLTYSCYEGRDYHCGRCGTCHERQEAFRDSGVPDPTTYLTYRET
jgi:7-cyano-7-deazaguanine synthase